MVNIFPNFPISIIPRGKSTPEIPSSGLTAAIQIFWLNTDLLDIM